MYMAYYYNDLVLIEKSTFMCRMAIEHLVVLTIDNLIKFKLSMYGLCIQYKISDPSSSQA